MSTGTAVQSPFTFYYSSNNDWSSSHNYDYWNINFTSAADANNTATIKTIYDPSPTSFTLPKTAAFTGFSTTGGNTSNSSQFNVSGSFNKGWYFLTGVNSGILFLNTFGYRDVWSGRSANGEIRSVCVEGNYLCSGAMSLSAECRLCFTSNYLYVYGGEGKSYGAAIQSVKE